MKLSMAVALLGGVVKGVVGFAMPMVVISGVGSVVSPELALAGVIVPTLITNMWQALRQGQRAAWESLRKFRIFLISGGVVLVFSAQLVRYMPPALMLLLMYWLYCRVSRSE